MNHMNVTKRDGSTESLNIEKIHKVTEWACNGLAVSQSELEVEAHLLFFPGIKTSQIHDALINAAAGLNSVESQDYTFVAGRLLLQKLYKESWNSISYPTLRAYIEKGVDAKRLDAKLLSFDLEALNAHIDPSRDLQFTYIGLQTLADRYFIRDDNSRIIELPQHFYMRVAMGLAIQESEGTEWAVKFYDLLSSHAYHSSTPTLFNAGTLHSQLASCFLNTVADTITNEEGTHRFASIYGTIEECAILSKYAGGLGTDWQRVRDSGSWIKGTNGKSTGIVPFLKVYNDTAVAVNQCFAPDTLIRTSSGVAPISDIRVGDMVLGQRGAFREVRETMSYNQFDAMVSVKVKHSLSEERVTAGHPFFAIQGLAGEQSIKRSLAQVASGKAAPRWVEAGSLKRNDYVAQVVPDAVVPVQGFTEDDARLYGILLGDGHVSLRSEASGAYAGRVKEWGVTGSSKDEETLVFVAKYLDNIGVPYYFSQVGSQLSATQLKWSHGGGAVRTNSLGQFAEAIPCLPFGYDDLYDAAGNKRIAARFMHLPLSQAVALVQGLVEADGCISRGKEISFTNTSIQLIEGVRYQMLRLGAPTSGNKKVRDNLHLGSSAVTTSWELRLPAIEPLAKALGVQALTKFNWLRIDNHVFSRVSAVKPMDAIPMVHDLKVDGDHSYSTTSALVHNGGKRQGSFAPYIEPTHPDLYAFIDLKKESGDDHSRAHDIYPALWMSDLFFKRKAARGMWSFFSPNKYPELHELWGDAYERRYEELEAAKAYTHQIPVMDVWKKILNSLFETGHPWITFKDECNRRSPQQHAGVVHSSNLCTEITLNTSDDETAVCNIGSVNMAKIKSMPHLEQVVNVAMRMLDNVIDINYYGSDRARASNLKHRPVGLGLMGYTEFLVSRGIDWESQEHLDAADELMENFSYYAIAASSRLAEERGAYASYEGSLWSQGIFPIDTAKEAGKALTNRELSKDWPALRARVKQFGMRNSNTMAIAPTATISNIVGTTATIEPIFQREVTKKNMSGAFIVTDPCLRYGRPELCKEAFEIDPMWLIKAAAVRQKWLDQAQSTNIFVKASVKGKDLDQIYTVAHTLGLKTTYYLRGQSADVKKAEASVGSPIEATPPKDDSLESMDAVFCSIDNPDCESCQ